MTLTDELKILDNEIKANQAHYGLDRKAANISALSSGELDKYEYLTSKGLRYKPAVIERINLNILHWVKFLIKDQRKETKKRTFEETKKH